MYLSDADLLGFLALFVREVFLLRDLSHWTVCRSDLNKIQKNKLAIWNIIYTLVYFQLRQCVHSDVTSCGIIGQGKPVHKPT